MDEEYVVAVAWGLGTTCLDGGGQRSYAFVEVVSGG
jgi:hypothetical protein